MKRLLFVAALSIAALVVTGCATPPAPDPTAAAQTAASVATQSVWATYDLPTAGLTFAMPAGARVEDQGTPQPGLPPVITLYAPADQFPDGNVVTLVVSSYERPTGQELARWAEMYNAMGEMPVQVLDKRMVDLANAPGRSQQALTVETLIAGEQRLSVLLPHGRLVIDISGPKTVAMQKLLPAIAASVRFASDAPTTLAELYGVDWEAPSLQDVYDERMAALAVTPRPGIVESDAATSTAIALMTTPGPTKTYSPDMQAAEDAYNASVATAAALTLLTPPPATATPVPTPTPLPAGQEGLYLYRGASSYQQTPRFQVKYEAKRWKLDGETLQHRLLPGCALHLAAGGRGVLGPAVVDWRDFGGFEWRVMGLPAERMISYALDRPEGYFLFVAEDPVLSSEGLNTPCRAAVEAVIATFVLLAD